MNTRHKSETAVSKHSAETVGTLRAVIFDFDGTLADSYSAITASVNHVRAAHNLAPLQESEVRRHVGHGLDHLLEYALAGSVVEADLARYRAHHPSVMHSGTHLLPGVPEVLATLKRIGLHVAVCSNKPSVYTRELLDHLGLARLVDLLLGPQDVARLKPAPDMLQAALRRLRVTPSEALYVGDMVLDIEAAREAGIPVWVVPTGSDDRATLVQAEPDRILQDLRELTTLI